MADALNAWLPDIFPAVKPFVSTGIEGGLKWFNEVESNLEDARFGIVCLTLDSYSKPWVNFEAGALLTTFKGNRVCPYYLDGKATDYEPPLGLMQMLKADKEGTLGLVRSISSVLSCNDLPTHDDVRLSKHFERWWENLEEALRGIPPEPDGGTEPEARSSDDMIREILGMLRQRQPDRIPSQLLARYDQVVPGLGALLSQVPNVALAAIRMATLVNDAKLSPDEAIVQAMKLYQLEMSQDNIHSVHEEYLRLCHPYAHEA